MEFQKWSKAQKCAPVSVKRRGGMGGDVFLHDEICERVPVRIAVICKYKKLTYSG